ncbi:hypothetical protein OA07_23005 [Aphanizomenon flos-aquae 2012/KM1/D3]|nr:hypothetical protein OA07_23005 [Aphanizomenon flos-aquae 2012/KM1/D3]
MVISQWSVVSGHWSLVIGHWSLVIGHWVILFFVLPPTANCHQTRNKNPTPNPLPASDEGAKMYLI